MTENEQERLELDKKLLKMSNNLLSGISCLITTSIFIIISIWCKLLF